VGDEEAVKGFLQKDADLGGPDLGPAFNMKSGLKAWKEQVSE